MGEKHLPDLIFVVVLVFSYDSIILENIYVFYHIFRLFIGNRKPIALIYTSLTSHHASRPMGMMRSRVLSVLATLGIIVAAYALHVGRFLSIAAT